MYKTVLYYKHMGRDSSVGIATRYGLDGLGIEAWWRRGFLQPPKPALGPNQPLMQGEPGLSRALTTLSI